jgi:glycosyltransferase involved in cell wall biosynthesis
MLSRPANGDSAQPLIRIFIMNISIISYEYPPDTGGGGIGTYAKNAARMLAERGHSVEVFAGGEEASERETPNGARVHRIESPDRASFAQEVVPRFRERHTAVGFDVVEGPEYHAEAQGIREAFPELPLAVKLHTASCVLQDVNVNKHRTVWDKARFLFGALRRGEWSSSLPWSYGPSTDLERKHALEADIVVAPSRSIGDLMIEWWGLNRDKVFHCPYPFEATDPFLSVDPDTDTQRITFIGRLEMRKGVLDLARAVPRVLEQRPDASFRLIGRSLNHPKTGEDLRSVMERELRSCKEAVEFTGQVPYDHIPNYLEQTDICVFPSLYESFGLVCLEAMSTARGVVGSRAGGMREMLDDGRYGRVVEPENPTDIANAILDLLDHPEERKRLGRAARQQVLDEYSFEAIGPRQEASYRRAIERHGNSPN